MPRSYRRTRSILTMPLVLSLVPLLGRAAAAEWLPTAALATGQVAASPVSDAGFLPGADAEPALANPVIDGRDARLFPGVTLEFPTLDDRLAPFSPYASHQT